MLTIDPWKAKNGGQLTISDDVRIGGTPCVYAFEESV